MATCYEHQGNRPGITCAPANFWRGLALGLSLWMVLVGALLLA